MQDSWQQLKSGQYFMTKDTEEFSQFTEPVTCREYTLPRDEKSSAPKGWIWGNTNMGPVLEVTTSYLQGKNGVEIRIESEIKDNSHSWVRISHGLNELVTGLIDKAAQRLKQNHEDLPLLAHLQELYLSVKDLGLILSQQLVRLSPTQYQNDWVLFFFMVIYLEKKMERSNSGDWKMIFGTNLSTLNIGLMICGRVEWQEVEATRKDFNIVLTRQDKKFFALQGHSGRNPICESGCAYHAWYHRFLDKHVDEGATRCCIWEQCSRLLCTFYGNLDLEFPALSRQTWRNLQHGLRLHVPGFYSKRTVNIRDVLIADYLVAEVWCDRMTVVMRRWHELCWNRVGIPSLSLAFFVGIPVVCLSPLHSVERTHICT